jgi:hypothetical protein
VITKDERDVNIVPQHSPEILSAFNITKSPISTMNKKMPPLGKASLIFFGHNRIHLIDIVKRAV